MPSVFQVLTSRSPDPTHDRETLGPMNAIKEWRRLLVSNPHTTESKQTRLGLRFFKLPQNLSYRHGRRSGEQPIIGARTIHQGTHNAIADALSRSPGIDPEDLKEDTVLTLLPKALWTTQ